MIATITNLIYFLAGYTAIRRRSLALAVSLIILGVFSTLYHHAIWQGHAPQPWQDLDVSAIFLVLGIFPYAITRRKQDLIYLGGTLIFILNRFIPVEPLNSDVAVGLMAIPTIILGFIHGRRNQFVGAMVFILFGLFAGYLANQYGMTLPGYDVPHGMWHLYSGISFLLLQSAMKKE